MKLLELMLQEKVQWPDGALWAVQDFDWELKFTETDEPPERPVHSCTVEVWYRNGCGHFDSLQLTVRASDWGTKAVSRCKYYAAMVAAGYMCPGDASCTDQGCPHHYASDVVDESQTAHATVRDWYAELAPVIAAAAEGKVVQYLAADGNWYTNQGTFMHPSKYRVKPEEPKTIKVNGFDVPEPMREAPVVDTRCFIAWPLVPDYFEEVFYSTEEYIICWLSRGLLHRTPEAAVAHAKAMLGIDPYADEDADDEHA